MKIFEAYDVLKSGDAVSPDLISTLIDTHEAIATHQWSSLTAFLLSKTATPHEQSLLSWIFEHIPICHEMARIDRGEERGDEMERTFLRKLNAREEVGEECIRWWISGIVTGTISTERIAFFLGKITCCGMHSDDLRRCIQAMVASGTIYDYRNLRELEFRKIIRRYPTGALSEKGALVLPALLASIRDQFPVSTPFLVARSLSFTGGTWDKLSSIPGFCFPSPGEESILAMQRCGVAMTVTHHDANPADRILYQLRSQTGTVECDDLIISSIVSKQLTFPVDELLLDVRYGSGAFLPTQERAAHVGSAMAQALRTTGVPTSYSLTDASEPNGSAIGNALEIIEAFTILNGCPSTTWNQHGLQKQRDIALRLFSILLHNTFPHVSEARFHEIGEESLNTGKALRSFLAMLHHHCVPESVIEALQKDPWQALLPGLSATPVPSPRSGTLRSIDQKKLGNLVNFSLSPIGDGKTDTRAGVQLNKRLGDTVNVNEPLAWVFSHKATASYLQEILSCFAFSTDRS